jgi:hypothetical protein
MPMTDRFKRNLDSLVVAIPHADGIHSLVWSMPSDLEDVTANFRQLWELGERPDQDDISTYLEGKSISVENCSQFQNAWQTVDFCLSKKHGTLALK